MDTDPLYDEVRQLLVEQKLSQNQIEKRMRGRVPRDKLRVWIRQLRG